MRKADRIRIINNICKEANLPSGRETAGYFTRHQLAELYLYLVTTNKAIDKLKSQMEDLNERSSYDA